MQIKERLNSKTLEGLKNYFEQTGVRKEWFARKIGMPRSMIYAIAVGDLIAPPKYWEKIINMSQGFVKLEYLISDYLLRNLKNLPFIEIEQIEGETKWIILAKMPEKNL
jgi:hypothetical protein